MFPQSDHTTSAPRRRRRWAAGAASALAAAVLAGGGTAVALQAHSAPAQAAQAPQSPADEPLAELTSLDGLSADVTAADAGSVTADDASLVQPAAAAPSGGATPSPKASGSAAKHPARAALRRVLAVVIRQDGTAQYGTHAQNAARAAANRYAAAFRHLPEKLRQDLWTLAGAPAGQEVADAQAIKAHALDGTYGDAVKKLAEAIQKAPAKVPATPAPSSPAAPSPSPSAGS